ncbi:hypothetical protein CCH79_00002733 [Gambusia affinis]|uniref:Uncharacterized protein n=1 Tax=Gambusia affinis TaxID=33528 RepID=A0A315W657_GAMAF|nr:hypothetical protein CCH79_00002733 [Gambusia affinis]
MERMGPLVLPLSMQDIKLTQSNISLRTCGCEGGSTAMPYGAKTYSDHRPVHPDTDQPFVKPPESPDGQFSPENTQPVVKQRLNLSQFIHRLPADFPSIDTLGLSSAEQLAKPPHISGVSRCQRPKMNKPAIMKGLQPNNGVPQISRFRGSVQISLQGYVRKHQRSICIPAMRGGELVISFIAVKARRGSNTGWRRKMHTLGLGNTDAPNRL